ncbi:MAG TPA: adenylate/guanylate cyclase domain-containing protein [Bacteroidetes bacterium]|nr:adenylate/guanylate cyclase domain-containing protein [Bacteroidota bacterium]
MQLISRKNLTVLAILLVAGLLTAILAQFSFMRNLELKTVDFRFRLRGPLTNLDSSLVIVAIDDQTFASIPHKWPYPRSYYAKLIRNLDEAGARLIVFDLEFTEPYVQDPAQDQELARAARESGKVVFAGKLVTEFGGAQTINRYVLQPIAPISHPGDSLAPLPWGLVNIVEDNDGFLRRYFVLKEIGGHRYYSLAVEAYRQLFSVPDDQIRDAGKEFVVGELHVPKASPETFMINYVGPTRTFHTYSFANILDDFEFDLGDEDTDIFEMHKIWGTFQNKIVFVGASAQELQDVKLTPFFQYAGTKQKMPGVEVHANALHTLLTRQFLRRFPRGLSALVVLLMLVLTMLFVYKLKPLRGGGAALVLFFGYLVGTYLAFANANLILPFISPTLAIALGFLGGTAHLYVAEQREKMRYRQIFQKYVSQNVVEKMLESGEYPTFGGERKVLTVLFSDIRQFTNFSEKHSPDEVVQRLSEYLTEMTEIILAHDGTLDKYVGDEIMAVFGAPFFFKDHAAKACRAAIGMMKRLGELRARYAARNGEYFNIGIGIHTGEMVVGNLGSRQLFDYTVIGDAVNLGARLEGLNKFYGTNIIISEDTLQAAGRGVIARELDIVRVKGKELPIRIYELLGMDKVDARVQKWLVEAYGRGLEAYYAQKWYSCLKEMNAILREFPHDGPARLYIKRCLDYLENPPAPDWKPVTTYDRK